ncbi:MAG: hypothetical protein EB060_01230 [Proteobacteria bacterium]|nr:hypothetical protein [Pseudomonadota bacterium]
MELSRIEQMNMDNLFCCVLAKGKDSSGEAFYIYFGIHMDNLEKLVATVKETGSFNPKDFQAAVLARHSGEPPKEVRDFLRERFSFSDNSVVLELA